MIEGTGRPESALSTSAPTQGALSQGAISFGPFTLVPSQRLLTKDGEPVVLGARAFDILTVLASRANQLVTKKDLIDLVWRGVTVGEDSLWVQIAGLRRALGDGRNGERYIVTVSGRGYSFVAKVSPQTRQHTIPAPAAAGFSASNLPSHPARMVGRSDGVRMLSSLLVTVRFITIVGSGGVGKTTVAVAVAHYLIESFRGIVLFVDLGALSDPNLVATSLAAMLGLPVQTNDPTPSLIAYLRDKRILLIFDNCEHIIDATAQLAERIFIAAPQVHILATSREALRVDGEHVHRLAPLACPPDEPGLTAAAALAFPAVQLFMQRATATGVPLNLTDADAEIVAGICRRLDGVALAIELVAARVAAYGLRQLAALLEERLALLWKGKRTAPPRQQTLKATLEWSYALLSEPERRVLRQLGVFSGDFSAEAALAVLTSPGFEQMRVLDALGDLVAKSMIASHVDGATMRYRLLDTTRDYVLELPVDAGEIAAVAARHATYYQRWLEQSEGESAPLSDTLERGPRLADLGNVHTALEWCFGAGGNAEIGVGLAAAAAPAFLAISLLTECHRWSERAILALDAATGGGRAEMLLQAALGISLMLTRGSTEAARVALTRGLAIAEKLADARTQVRLLGPLAIFHVRFGDFETAMDFSKRAAAISATITDPDSITLGHCCIGCSLLHTGDLAGARRELEAAIDSRLRAQKFRVSYFGFDYYCLASVNLAQILWLQGFPVRAVAHAQQIVKYAAGLDHPVTLLFTLHWAVPVYLLSGDLQLAEEHTDWLISRAESHSLALFGAMGRGFKGALAVRRGDAKTGVEILQASLADLYARRHELLITPFTISLAQGLAAIGRAGEGIALLDERIRLAAINGNLGYTPELLRVKGALLLSLRPSDDAAAAACFTDSLSLSKRQGALSWELRSAMELAMLWAARGQAETARALLRSVLEQFTEGFDTEDVKAAVHALAVLEA